MKNLYCLFGGFSEGAGNPGRFVFMAPGDVPAPKLTSRKAVAVPDAVDRLDAPKQGELKPPDDLAAKGKAATGGAMRNINKLDPIARSWDQKKELADGGGFSTDRIMPLQGNNVWLRGPDGSPQKLMSRGEKLQVCYPISRFSVETNSADKGFQVFIKVGDTTRKRRICGRKLFKNTRGKKSNYFGTACW